ncbi:MAG: SDR family NAD(P)-dependent oxidoreductase [Acidimicrobiia bacterium]
MDLQLADKVVLVTGGAGGIGAAICRAFANEGARVAVHYHSSDDAAKRLADEIGGAAFAADLTDAAEAVAMVNAVVGHFGGLDVCAANAGWYPSEDKPIWEVEPDRFATVIDRNLTVAYTTARAFLGRAAITGHGALIFTSSTAGHFGEAGHADYAAAKAALSYGFLNSLKNEAARIGDGVRVNAVAPGWTVTPKREAAGVDETHVAKATSTMSRKQLATPDDVARQVVVLASDVVSAHQTGQVVTVAGGMEGRQIP